MIEKSCDDLVRDLLAQGGEGTTDFKAATPWPAKGSDERARLIKHMIGYSNARDGGYLLIGVDDLTKQATGLTDAQARTWDPSSLAEALDQFAAPPPRLKVCQGRTDANHLLVAIHIAEFADQPTVCIREHASSVGAPAKRMILRKGALYVRHGASTKEIDNEALMRELLRRAYIKNAQALLQQIKELIDLYWPRAQPPPDAAIRARIQDALRDVPWP